MVEHVALKPHSLYRELNLELIALYKEQHIIKLLLQVNDLHYNIEL